MNKLIKSFIMAGILSAIPITTWSNDIYIEQVGDTLDLDIVQDGQNNKIGTGTQAAVLGLSLIHISEPTRPY